MDITHLTEGVNFEHSRKVSAISAIIAEAIGYPAQERELIKQAALYHDLGKESIPKDILNKPGPLTSEEYEIIKGHTDAGALQLTDAARFLKVAAQTAREHHEKIDGSGYMGLLGDEIHPYSKIIAAADVLDALYSKRVYKDRWSMRDILNYFRDQSGKQFEREIVVALINVIDRVLCLYL